MRSKRPREHPASRRVAACAQVMWQKPHLLLLDEPTNHLDLDAVEALIHALLSFEGGVLVISHDEHLVTQLARTIALAGMILITPLVGDAVLINSNGQLLVDVVIRSPNLHLKWTSTSASRPSLCPALVGQFYLRGAVGGLTGQSAHFQGLIRGLPQAAARADEGVEDAQTTEASRGA